MDYGELVEVYTELEATSATLEKTDVLADLLMDTPQDHLPLVVTLLRGSVFAEWESTDLGMSSSLALDAIEKATGISEAQIENWWREEGDLGDAAARAVETKAQQTLFNESLTVHKVHSTLEELADYAGSGSQARRVDALAGLLTASTPDEARYIVRTVTGAMRLGVGEGLVRDAIAQAFLDGSDDATAAVERAYEVTNDFRTVAETARTSGTPGLRELDIKLFRPIKPMVAQKADGMPSAVSTLGDETGDVLVETKYDGIRAKLHADGETTKMFTRRLEDVTVQFPDVVNAVEDAMDAESYIIEGEVVGFDPDTGQPVPFQRLSQRIKRKYDIEAKAEEIPVTLYLFDVLYLNGDSLIDDSLRSRLDRLERALTTVEGTVERANHVQTDAAAEAGSFYEDALDAGHEGVMVKNLDASYQPGSRVGYQLKVKSTMEPLDLVVTRAKWSEGRKSEFLGRPYLACRDETDDTLREVGRMHTGFTDAQLEEFTALVEPLIQSIDGREADLKPEVVLEVEYEEIQESPKYDSGYALRFPRLSRIRTDLDPGDADTFQRVESLFQNQS